MYKRTIVAALLFVFLSAPNISLAALAVDASGVLAFTNAQRYMAGLPSLFANASLSQVALMKMQDMFARQYFAHEAPTGEVVSDLAKRVGYSYLSVGENLALGDFVSNKHVVDSWMGSPGHKKNILSETYSEIGIAAGRGVYEGRSVWVIVQAFGLPRSSCPELDAKTKSEIEAINARLSFLSTIIELRKASTEEKNISRSVYIKRVESYNIAVTIYNELVRQQRLLVASYNSGVDSFNDCIETTFSKSELSH